MPFKPVKEIDQDRYRNAVRTLCEVFEVPALREMQKQAGLNIIRGDCTILDVPTGGGKTLAFWLSLFYHWSPGDTSKDSQKMLLVVGPLTGLMDSQAKALNARGIPAVAMTSVTENLDQVLKVGLFNFNVVIRWITAHHKDFAANKYRVGFVGPELGNSPRFHNAVLKSEMVQDNLICVIADEGHCISEWGTDDFRPEYGNIATLLGRLPSGVPILVASATLPPEIVADIKTKLKLPHGCKTVSVSNAKPNVALSVRILQHPQGTFADLLALFPLGLTDAADFPQTLIYVNSRQEAEKIQDFLRAYCPECMSDVSFEFYHRHIAEKRKTFIQDSLNDGLLSAVPATDALGMVSIYD